MGAGCGGGGAVGRRQHAREWCEDRALSARPQGWHRHDGASAGLCTRSGCLPGAAIASGVGWWHRAALSRRTRAKHQHAPLLQGLNNRRQQQATHARPWQQGVTVQPRDRNATTCTGFGGEKRESTSCEPTTWRLSGGRKGDASGRCNSRPTRTPCHTRTGHRSHYTAAARSLRAMKDQLPYDCFAEQVQHRRRSAHRVIGAHLGRERQGGQLHSQPLHV